MSRTITLVPKPPKLERKKRVAAYARVSSGKDAMLHSLSARVSFYSNFIQNHPEWEYVGVYADEAQTGTKDSRENFQLLLSDCRAGNIEIKLTYLIQRIGTEYLKNRRNKGFRNIWRDRKPFYFYDSSYSDMKQK